MRTRTSNLLIRSQVLYPIELWALIVTTEASAPSVGSAGSVNDAHDRTRTCTPFLALVPQTSLSTSFSTWAMLGRGLEPPRGNPHKVLNLARLPIPPSEQY